MIEQTHGVPAQAVITGTLMSMANNYSMGCYFLNEHTSKGTGSLCTCLDEEED